MYLRSSLPPALISLSVVYASTLASGLQWTIQTYVDVENGLTSVERITHYNDGVEKEAKEMTSKQFRPDASWPQHGEIEFNDLKLRYREDLDLVLKGIDCHIKSCEKIGICGRTGALGGFLLSWDGFLTSVFSPHK